MQDEAQCECHTATIPPPGRRGFFKKAATVVLGALSVLGPLGAGLAVLLDPVRRKGAGGPMRVRVTTLNSLPEDGIPRKFAIVGNRVDAWNKSPAVALGAVYLRRTPGQPVQALNVVCPHAGCFVDYVPGKSSYLCPCHNSTFGLDGKINDPASPSPRALDELTVEIRNENEVWVQFQNYRAGVVEKIPA